MTLPPDVSAACGYVDVARADAAKGFFQSACLTAQKAAEVALQAWLATQGMGAHAETLPALLAGIPGRTAELGRAAEELERFRLDMGSPYRSAPGPEPDATPEAALACCAAAEAIVAHVRQLFALAGEEVDR